MQSKHALARISLKQKFKKLLITHATCLIGSNHFPNKKNEASSIHLLEAVSSICATLYRRLQILKNIYQQMLWHISTMIDLRHLMSYIAR